MIYLLWYCLACYALYGYWCIFQIGMFSERKLWGNDWTWGIFRIWLASPVIVPFILGWICLLLITGVCCLFEKMGD